MNPSDLTPDELNNAADLWRYVAGFLALVLASAVYFLREFYNKQKKQSDDYMELLLKEASEWKEKYNDKCSEMKVSLENKDIQIANLNKEIQDSIIPPLTIVGRALEKNNEIIEKISAEK